MGISCSFKMGSHFPLLSKAELASDSSWIETMCVSPCCLTLLHKTLFGFFSTTGTESQCQGLFQRNRMSWAAANLIRKTKKEKKNCQKVRGRGVGKAATCLSLLAVLPCSELAQADRKCQGLNRQALAAALLHVKHPGCLTQLSFSSDMLLDHQCVAAHR